MVTRRKFLGSAVALAGVSLIPPIPAIAELIPTPYSLGHEGIRFARPVPKALLVPVGTIINLVENWDYPQGKNVRVCLNYIGADNRQLFILDGCHLLKKEYPLLHSCLEGGFGQTEKTFQLPLNIGTAYFSN